MWSAWNKIRCLCFSVLASDSDRPAEIHSDDSKRDAHRQGEINTVMNRVQTV